MPSEPAETKAARLLQDEIARDPDWGPFIEHWASEGLSAQAILKSLRNAKFDAWRRHKGYHRGRNAAQY
jgi:hypothetical protein